MWNNLKNTEAIFCNQIKIHFPEFYTCHSFNFLDFFFVRIQTLKASFYFGRYFILITTQKLMRVGGT